MFRSDPDQGGVVECTSEKPLTRARDEGRRHETESTRGIRCAVQIPRSVDEEAEEEDDRAEEENPGAMSSGPEKTSAAAERVRG